MYQTLMRHPTSNKNGKLFQFRSKVGFDACTHFNLSVEENVAKFLFRRKA